MDRARCQKAYKNLDKVMCGEQSHQMEQAIISLNALLPNIQPYARFKALMAYFYSDECKWSSSDLDCLQKMCTVARFLLWELED